MGSRSMRHISYKRPSERSSLGDAHVDTAVGNLKKAAMVTAGLMAEYTLTREATLPMLFHDTDLEKLKQVRELVQTSSIKGYEVLPKTTLFINYSDALVPSIEPKALFVQNDRALPLLKVIEETRAVHNRFEEVKAVLQWLNRNATPGAIRYYFPAAMKLCPKATCWADLQDVPSRYNVPAGIEHWLQAIKDAATTVASMEMLPNDAKAKPQDQMWLTFSSVRVALSPTQEYMTDAMTYQL